MTFYSAQALGLLARSPLLHMDMIESVQRGHAQILDVTSRSVLQRDLPSGALMLSASDADAARAAVREAPRPPLFVAHQPYCLDAIGGEFGLPRRVVCRQAVYCFHARLPQPAGIDIRPLDAAALPFVAAHYSGAAAAGGTDYLRSRLAAGALFGAFLAGEPAGFIGSHAEGSIGMLEVLPAFRRRGVATALESFLVNRMLGQGYTPFAQIVEGNAPSLRLHRRLGFSLADEPLYWLVPAPPAD